MSAGKLDALDRGVLKGEIRLDDRLRRLPGLTIEVLAHGITLRTHSLAVPADAADVLPFAFEFAGFPDVTLPCDLRARIIETDSLLESAVRLESIEDVWRTLMPFSVHLEQVQHNLLTLRLEEHVPGAVQGNRPVFQLRDWGRLVATSTLLRDKSATLSAIVLPDWLLDGNEHRLSIVHQQSGLPVTAQPILLRLDIQTEPGPTLPDLAQRLARIETAVQERHAEVFASMATPLYRHIDTMIQNQRGNFERETAALRRLLGVADANTADTEALSEVRLDFAGPVIGFGVHDVQHTATGKPFRQIGALAGFLLPGLRDGQATLHVQGIRRAHPGALDQASLAVNGHPVPMTLYLNPKSESWNITAQLGRGLLRPDRNLVELRLPQEGPAWAAPEHVAGIIHLAISRPRPETADTSAAAD